MKKIVIGICIIALLPCLGLANDLTGRDIAVKMDAVDTSLDSKRTAIMVINRKGQKLVRKMESCNKKYGQDERGLIKFIEPPDVRGIMYLTWSYEDTISIPAPKQHARCKASRVRRAVFLKETHFCACR